MPERKVEYFKNPATFWLSAGIYSLVFHKKSFARVALDLYFFGSPRDKISPKKEEGDSVAQATNICIKKGEEYANVMFPLQNQQTQHILHAESCHWSS